MEEGLSPRLGSAHSAAVGSPRSHGAKDYREEIRNKRQLTVIPELHAQESLDALPIRMSEACTLRRTRPNSNNPAPYKIVRTRYKVAALLFIIIWLLRLLFVCFLFYALFGVARPLLGRTTGRRPSW
jgi:hypothetical protein